MLPSLPAVVLIVLHRRWDRLSHLREVLAHGSNLPIVIAAQGERFEPGMAYIGEPADHLTLAARSFGENRGSPNAYIDLSEKAVALDPQPGM